MNFYRNPEIKKSFVIHITATAIATIIGASISRETAYFTMIIGLLFSVLHFFNTFFRYKKIAELSKMLDQILHGKEEVNFENYYEGELSILQNELSKMTIKLKEQTNELKRDKIHLTDSIADISHQLRTPLTSINLICSFLRKSDITNEKRIQLTNDLNKFILRIEWLISSLLKLSKIDAGTANFKHEAVDVKEMLAKAYEPFAIPMELKNQELLIHLMGDETFLGDLAWSIEAFGNVLKNCMEHTPVGGIIEISCNENSIYTELIISDNGLGIDKEDLPHLFERFYKGKNSSDQSVGIGLALARMIIKEQNGTIKVENNLDNGAKFTIRFYKVIV